MQQPDPFDVYLSKIDQKLSGFVEQNAFWKISGGGQKTAMTWPLRKILKWPAKFSNKEFDSVANKKSVLDYWSTLLFTPQKPEEFRLSPGIVYPSSDAPLTQFFSGDVLIARSPKGEVFRQPYRSPEIIIEFWNRAWLELLKDEKTKAQYLLGVMKRLDPEDVYFPSSFNPSFIVTSFSQTKTEMAEPKKKPLKTPLKSIPAPDPAQSTSQIPVQQALPPSTPPTPESIPFLSFPTGTPSSYNVSPSLFGTPSRQKTPTPFLSPPTSAPSSSDVSSSFFGTPFVPQKPPAPSQPFFESWKPGYEEPTPEPFRGWGNFFDNWGVDKPLTVPKLELDKPVYEEDTFAKQKKKDLVYKQLRIPKITGIPEVDYLTWYKRRKLLKRLREQDDVFNYPPFYKKRK